MTKLLCSLLFREKLKQLIEKRIGKENFVEKLCFITKHELYSRAAQKPQPVFPSPEQMLFDHEFTKLVKELEGQSRHIHPNTNSLRELLQSFSWPNELCSSPYFSTGVITKAVHKSSEEEKKEEEVKKTLEQHDNIVTQYKELIREQVNNTIIILLHVVFVQFDVLSCWQIDFDHMILRTLSFRSWRSRWHPWPPRMNSYRLQSPSSSRRSSSTKTSTTSSSWN